MKHLYILITLLLLCLPAFAQDAEATPDVLAPVVVNIEAPVETPTQDSNDIGARDLLYSLIVIVVGFMLHQSVPANKLKELWDKADARAKQTPQTWDDAAVEFGKFVSEALKQWQARNPESPATITKTETTSISSTGAPSITTPSIDLSEFGKPVNNSTPPV